MRQISHQALHQFLVSRLANLLLLLSEWWQHLTLVVHMLAQGAAIHNPCNLSWVTSHPPPVQWYLANWPIWINVCRIVYCTNCHIRMQMANSSATKIICVVVSTKKNQWLRVEVKPKLWEVPCKNGLGKKRKRAKMLALTNRKRCKKKSYGLGTIHWKSQPCFLVSSWNPSTHTLILNHPWITRPPWSITQWKKAHT